MLEKKGYRVVVFHLRGTSTASLTTPQIFTFGDAPDLLQAIRHVHQQAPNSPLVAIGYSLGANILVKCIGDLSVPEQKILKGMISIAQGYNGLRCVQNLLEHKWSLYHFKIYHKMKNLLRRHAHHYEGKFDVQAALRKVHSIVDFDREVTCKLHNWENPETYYLETSCFSVLPKISIPMLLVNAVDDPIAIAELIPYNLPEQNENVILATTDVGGHLGWAQGWFWPRKTHWHDIVTMDFVTALLSL